MSVQRTHRALTAGDRLPDLSLGSGPGNDPVSLRTRGRLASVVVHGGFYVIHPEGAALEREAWMKGLGLLRTLIPETFRDDDPVPFRTLMFRIAVQEASGREAYIC